MITETNEPASERPEVAAAGAHWSDRTVQRLARGRVIGVLAVISGAILFAVGETHSTLTHNLMSSSGLSLLTIGVIMFVAVSRTRDLAPDRPFAPLPITNPRMWFVLLWGAGLAVSVILSLLDTADLVDQLIMLALSMGLMTAGCVWVVRWLSGQRAKFWPTNSELPLRWVPSWTVLWASVWGAASTLLAILIEAAPLLALALLSGTAFEEVPQTKLSSFEGIDRAMRNPALLAAIFAGAVIGAPLVEEAVKAVGLRGLRRWIQHPADGWLLGFAAGLGFGLLEGAFNLDATENWFLGGWMRLAALLLHGLATSLTGLGYARYLQTQQRDELRRGYLRAATMHGLWNASALTIAFTGYAVGYSSFTRNVLPFCFAGTLIIGAVVLMVLLLRRVSTASVQTSIQEDHQQAEVPLPGGWS
ncbi:MAG TPA: PrsW family glutamic-type intramembrane protease, partial [Anaerolineae bacterium]|nr:PrsW family glutamic-type intramembrane protease [Anaerolineae bacterium]